ncbi:unnamed protein product [Parascedosporium putredinis]|uniref:Uncharacterized protein n=1 Tax=Parascedosporium putredinis TaxID=1442378 RepID=A0A9P1M9T6_9PEZI|nr:unnamed protein product [Parascedosporium putredinis]CAI7991414.1 unnamed protein product [Parascedosporium putredinis]
MSLGCFPPQPPLRLPPPRPRPLRTHLRLLDLGAANALDAVDHLSDYFNLLASKVQRYKSLAGSLPPATLPAPSSPSGLSLQHVAIGRGTQNYTCDPADPSAAPKAAGAVAILYDATCLASTHADLLDALSRLSISYPHPRPSRRPLLLR